MTLELTTYHDAMAALRSRDLAQALYDAGQAVMADALITLHGAAHTRRRVVEFGVFERDYFRHYERDVFPRTMTPVIDAALATGRADLVELGYRITMNLTADFAGIDRPIGDAGETETLLGLVRTFSEGATLVHSTRNPADVNAEVAAAMTRFDDQFLQPSIARRQALVLADADTRPRDVLTTLLRHADKVDLTPDALRREIAFYLQAGAHSTANSVTHAIHEIFGWLVANETDPLDLVTDPLTLQRLVHESLRLHPASPVAWRKAMSDTTVAGRSVARDERIVVHIQRANRDPAVFGTDAEEFVPGRSLPADVRPYGLTFGGGTHACLGRELDGGALPDGGTRPNDHAFGIVTLVVRTLLAHGVAADPDRPPTPDANTARSNWGRYPVVFARPEITHA